ncbi:MAG: endonuclease III [Bacteroidales bacterium]
MTKRELFALVIDYFEKNRPAPETELVYSDPFELIVAVILSAQCTDKRVNTITPALLGRYPDARSMAQASPDDIYPFIKSCSYPNNKAKHLSAMSIMLTGKYNGRVPEDPEELVKLPGVGRKTANVIASVVYRRPVMAVDTHVFRVSRRIGLARAARTPLEVEKQLTRNIPPELMHKAHHWLILHGRYICKARKPDCQSCGLTGLCAFYKQNAGRSGKK